MIQVGTLLGSYEILSPLGKGGMGAVWRARDQKLAREVAIKTLPEEFARDGERLARFKREARILASLNHPNIATIYDIGEDAGVPYIAMEHIDGRTLRQVLSEGPLAEDPLIGYARQIAEGLTEAHQAGIVHRDLKPENVLVRADDYVKILDFGLAKHQPPLGGDSQATTVSSEDTSPGAILGTVAYMSPEQAKGLSVDFRSDQFAFGVILYELATGAPAFLRDTAAETLSAILRDEPEIEGRVSPSLAEVVGRCLGKEPEERYADTGELAERLALSRDVGAPVSPPSVPAIAVLPFNYLSPQASDEYFSDGLTEEIITDLSRVRAMKVISQKSAIQLKGSEKDLPTIGRELGVDYLLQGSVRRAGHQLRVTAQLIDLDSDAHVWADKYDGTMDDIFAIQEQIAGNIVDALKVQLSAEEDRRISERPIDDAQAFDCYLRARYEYSRGTREGVDAALRYVDQGLEIVGPNALLYAAKGNAYFHLSYIDTFRHREHLRVCRHWAEKILELEPDAARGHSLLGLVLFDLFETVEGLRHMERAFELDPNDVDNLGWLSVFYASVGNPERSDYFYGLLVVRDSLNPFTQFVGGMCDLLADRMDGAATRFEKAYSASPQTPQFRTAYAQVLACQGKADEAIELLAPFEAAGESHSWTTLGLILKSSLKADRVGVAGLVSEELETAFRTDLLFALMLAERYAVLGDKERACEWLEIAVEGGFWNSRFLESDPLLRNLQGEPDLARVIDRARAKTERLDSFVR